MQRRKDDAVNAHNVREKKKKQKDIIKYIELTKIAHDAREKSKKFNSNCTSIVASTDIGVCVHGNTVIVLFLPDD